MSLEKLKGNINEMEKILVELKRLQKNISYSDDAERKIYSKSYNSLISRLLMLNNAIPLILNDIDAIKKLNPESREVNFIKEKNIESFSYGSENEKNYVTLNKTDQKKFLTELGISKSSSVENKLISDNDSITKPSELARISNKFFSGLSEKIARVSLQDLKKDLRDSNSRFLLPTYLSIAFFVSSLVFLGSLIFFIVLAVVDPIYWAFIWVPFVLFIFSLLFFYFSPSLEKGSLKDKINQEIPFATIYMAAIAGSNIEPTKIFKIISQNKEYKYFGLEIRKVVNLVEIYGYDLVNSLKDIAKTTVSEKLSELLGGMATNIVSGGSLKNYLDKKADNLLMDYRLERERYNAVSATFMDIYISVLITAPLILVMMVVVMSVTGFDLGVPADYLVYISIGIIALINILFLIFLQIKQPKT